MRHFVSALIAAVLFAITLPAHAVEKGQFAGKPSPKVETFLKQVDQARSFDELKAATRNVNFTKQEQEQLQEAVKQRPAIAAKLQRFVDEERASSSARLEARTQEIIKQKEAEHAQRQTVQLKQANDQAMTKLATLKASKPAVATATRPPRAAAPMSGTVMRTQAPKPTGTSPGSINVFSPAKATIGKSLTISGDGFGTQAGRVVIGVERDRMDALVTSWKNREVVITVPEEFLSIAGMNEKVGFVWVKLRGSENGPYKDITFRPDIEGLSPKVTSLSTTELKPGVIMVIEGENFLAEQKGKVEFRFGDRKYEGLVSEWQDSYIVVKIHEHTHGLARTEGTLKVQNHLGLEAVKAITFVPNLSVKTYMGERTGVAIVLGYQEKKTEYDLSLINGWTVKENTLICGDKHWGWGSAGCKFVNQAVPGSTRVISRTLIWIDCLGVVVSKNFLTIEGPSGLPPTQ